MDSNKLSRKELQALCKSNGIPANKTNVFMVEALAKKKIPLSRMDANRDHRTFDCIGSSPFKPPPLLARKYTSGEVNSTGPTEQKPVLFQNNFLMRGKRKAAPSSHEMGHEGKPEVETVNNTYVNLQKSTNHSRRTQAAGATQVTNVNTDAAAARGLCPKVDTGLSRSSCRNLSDTATRESKMEGVLKPGHRLGTSVKMEKIITASAACCNGSINGANEKIEDRVRSQISAALCSKVMKAPAGWPSAPPSMESSQMAFEASMIGDIVDRCENLTLPLAPPVQQEDNLQQSLAKTEVLRLSVACPEQQMNNLSFPQPLVCASVTKGEVASTSTAAVTGLHRSASLEELVASPPISFSPVVRQVEHKMQSIVERVQNFWKAGRDLAVVNVSGLPVQ